jgi:hypothetical protein
MDARRSRQDDGNRADSRSSRNPDIVYVAALGNPYGPNPERGVFRSKDGGKTWERVLYHDEGRGRSICRSTKKSGRSLRWSLGGVPHAALALERRTWQLACTRAPTAARPGPT